MSITIVLTRTETMTFSFLHSNYYLVYRLRIDLLRKNVTNPSFSQSIWILLSQCQNKKDFWFKFKSYFRLVCVSWILGFLSSCRGLCQEVFRNFLERNLTTRIFNSDGQYYLWIFFFIEYYICWYDEFISLIIFNWSIVSQTLVVPGFFITEF